MDTPPFSVLYDLSKLSDAGADVVIEANGEQRKQLAKWVGLDEVGSFAANVTLNRPAANWFGYRAALTADITQSCVVTVQPVHSRLLLDVSRTLHLSKIALRTKVSPDEFLSGSNEEQEEIESLHYDLAIPVLEEFVLAIDPYPRAPGVVFEPRPSEAEVSDNPFRILKSLKSRD